MKKILIVSTVSRQFYLFEKGNIEVLKSQGYEVHGAANFSDADPRLDELGIIQHHFDIQRSPFSIKNLKAFKQLKQIIKSNGFDAIHCHSPMGGVIARLAANSCGIKPVIYTAHGFHFYKGAPVINWILYYTIERILSRYTDLIITINQEDFKIAKKFKVKQVVQIPGIGVDIEKFSNTTTNSRDKRRELGIAENTVVLLSVGELIKRKNHEIAIKALANQKVNNYIYLICGRGQEEKKLKELVKSLSLEDKVIFLGYRNDVPDICIASDIFVFPSYQEGLPVSVMEAMAAGLPIIGSNIRGNTDLIENNKGGYLLDPKDEEGLTNYIDKLIRNEELRNTFRKNNLQLIGKYSKENVKKRMEKIYGRIM
jgi:glycosyltransferase involved in cell wall biosynthesis